MKDLFWGLFQLVKHLQCSPFSGVQKSLEQIKEDNYRRYVAQQQEKEEKKWEKS